MMKKYFSLFLMPFLLGGCNWLEFPFFVLFGKTHENVKAEYTDLKGKRIAVVIAGLPAIDFEDPYARMDLALASAELIRQKVKEVQFVEQEKIERFQQENLGWISMPMREIGKKFGADRILYIELMQFTTVEPESVNLVRGRIWSQVSIYEVDSPQPNVPAYETEIQVVYPEQGPLPMSDTALIAARQQIIILYAQELSRKFHDHKRKIR
jgi:hypothetical protein